MSQPFEEKEDVIESLTKDIVKGNLSTLILVSIKHRGELSGYDIWMDTKQKFDVILSVGTVYSQLYTLERKCLIIGNTVGSGARKYSLTQEGEETTEVILAQKKRVSKVIDSMFEV